MKLIIFILILFCARITAIVEYTNTFICVPYTIVSHYYDDGQLKYGFRIVFSVSRNSNLRTYQNGALRENELINNTYVIVFIITFCEKTLNNLCS